HGLQQLHQARSFRRSQCALALGGDQRIQLGGGRRPRQLAQAVDQLPGGGGFVAQHRGFGRQLRQARRVAVIAPALEHLCRRGGRNGRQAIEQLAQEVCARLGDGVQSRTLRLPYMGGDGRKIQQVFHRLADQAAPASAVGGAGAG